MKVQNCFNCYWGGKEDDEFGDAFPGCCWKHNGEADWEQPDKHKGCKDWLTDKLVEIKDNQVHLCKSCKNAFPKCFAQADDVIFGSGVGNDNICACSKYEPLMERDDWR